MSSGGSFAGSRSRYAVAGLTRFSLFQVFSISKDARPLPSLNRGMEKGALPPRLTAKDAVIHPSLDKEGTKISCNLGLDFGIIVSVDGCLLVSSVS
jgi:hypothetical protein